MVEHIRMGTAEQPKSENPLGTASAVISLIGLTVCLIAFVWVYGLHSRRVAAAEKIATTDYEGGDLTVVTDTIEVGFTFLAQVVLYVIGGLVGGTLSLVGFILGLLGLGRQPNHPAKIGLVASLLGPLVLIGYLLIV